MKIIKMTGLTALALVAAFGVTSADAGQGGAKKQKQNSARNSAPGQQMLNNRTRATAPGNSFNAPGQRMIRQRTPGGTR